MRYRFADFELDVSRRSLRRGGCEVHLEPRVFDLVVCLIERRPRVVSKDELVERVWSGAFVTDGAIKRAVFAARAALGDDGERQRVIQTAYGRGYRFAAEVEELAGPAAGGVLSEAAAPRAPAGIPAAPPVDPGRPAARRRLRRPGWAAGAAAAAVLALAASALPHLLRSGAPPAGPAAPRAAPPHAGAGGAAAASRPPEALTAYRRGRRHLEFFSGDLPLAVAMFERAVEIDPGFAAAWAGLARGHAMLYQRGDDPTPERLEAARAAADRALELAPGLPEAQRAMSYMRYAAEQDYGRALEALVLGAEGNPGEDADLLSTLALIQRRSGRFEDAAMNLEEAVRVAPERADLLVVLGTTRLYLGRYGAADRALARAARLAPDQAAAFGWRALNHLAWRGDLVAAARALDEMPPSDDDFAPFCRWMLALDGRRYGEALELVGALPEEGLVFQFGFLPRPLLEAQTLELLGEPARARRGYLDARARLEAEVVSRPRDPRVHGALGLALAGLGDAEAAVREGRTAVELAPRSRDALSITPYLTLAEILARVGRTGEAVDELAALLAAPSWVSARSLALEPRWDPLRRESEFASLVGGSAAANSGRTAVD